MKGLMWKLLMRNLSKGQLAGYMLASLVGLSIVVISIQLYNDVKGVFEDNDSFVKKDYLVITKEVSGLGSLLGSRAEFTQNDIDDLKKQPWVTSVGSFTASDYSVQASIGLGGLDAELRTELFFESLPDEFIDVNTSDWGFDSVSSDPVLPIILSKDYLALYNFGFAAAQGMPQVSESMIGMVPLRFVLHGNGKSRQIRGKIVGFSNRLNTIVVPMEFMQWSNKEFADGGEKPTSRLIVEVNTPGDSRINEYMERNGYEIGGDKGNGSHAARFMFILAAVVAGIGVMITMLAFYILMLSIHLLMQKNKEKMLAMKFLGYGVDAASLPYRVLVEVSGVVVAIASVGVMVIVRHIYLPYLSSMGLGVGSITGSVMVAVLIMGAVTAGNIVSITQNIRRLWRR